MHNYTAKTSIDYVFCPLSSNLGDRFVRIPDFKMSFLQVSKHLMLLVANTPLYQDFFFKVYYLYVSQLAWKHIGVPWEELEIVSGEEKAWNILLSLLPCDPTSDKVKKMEGLMGGF